MHQIVRMRSNHGIAQHDNDLRCWADLVNSLCCILLPQIDRAQVADRREASGSSIKLLILFQCAAPPGRKKSRVRRCAGRKIVWFLYIRKKYLRMRFQVKVQRCRAALGCAKDKEIRPNRILVDQRNSPFTADNTTRRIQGRLPATHNSLSVQPASDLSRWHAGDDSKGLDILGHNRTSRYDRMVCDRHAVEDGHSGSDPNVVSHGHSFVVYALLIDRPADIRVIVVFSNDRHPRPHQNIVTNCYRSRAADVRIRANRTPVTHHQTGTKIALPVAARANHRRLADRNVVAKRQRGSADCLENTAPLYLAAFAKSQVRLRTLDKDMIAHGDG